MIGLVALAGVGAGIAAAARMRSPIRLVKRVVPFRSKPMTLRVWECDDDRLAIAELVNRTDPRQRAVLHRSTKEPGHWQMTWFDGDEPTGDVRDKTCTAALRNFSHKRWRLAKVVAR